ncbi:helix-turn-helix domain-containing protein [Streptomyces niger]|uniref:helix-turn-helix domain-containing protein n=1 Tax=Streptomyces niger TaxID=66373 RepID=UPI00069C489E|nr:helix-turn-helix transcriptional regulator [Streptomyces niger]
MPSPKNLDPTESLPALYGTKLRKLRTKAGWTQRELGAKVPIAHSRIAQFELGKETPPEDVSAALDRLLGADGDLTDLWQHARRAPFPGWARRYVDAESRADRIRKYLAHTVPGLLQTDAYARALLTVARPCVGEKLEEMVAARTARRALLQQPSPPSLWAVLDEAVLWRHVGGLAVMREQLEYLLHLLGRLDHVSVQILPFEQGAHPMLGGSLTVLSFTSGPEVAYLEGSHSGELVERAATVKEYALAFEHLQAQALPCAASAGLIRSALEGTYRDVRIPSRSQRRRVAQVQSQQHARRGLRRGR